MIYICITPTCVCVCFEDFVLVCCLSNIVIFLKFLMTLDYLFIFRKYVQGDSVFITRIGSFTHVKSQFLQSEHRWLQEPWSPWVFGDSQSSCLFSVFVEWLPSSFRRSLSQYHIILYVALFFFFSITKPRVESSYTKMFP